jgi:Flp pilus assembly secretin CpaC
MSPCAPTRPSCSGGLIQDNRSDGKTGVPGLYRAPIIGPLFGETSAPRAPNWWWC